MENVSVINRTIHPGQEEQFEHAMDEFAKTCSDWPGHIEMRLLKDSNKPNYYTIVNRFQSVEMRQNFVKSELYGQWMARLADYTESGPHIVEHHGMAAFFPGPSTPPRWKMAVLTFASVWPLSTLLGTLVRHLLPGAPMLLQGACITLLMVLCLTWLVMPNLTKLFRFWLFERK